MARQGLSMKQIDEVKRLSKLGFTNRAIARTLNIHRNTINKYIDEINTHPEFAAIENPSTKDTWVSQVDWESVRSEFLSGVSLNVIHEELVELKKVSVQYPGFWKQASKKINLSKATMVKIHKPGERAEIDYCDGIDIIDPVTNEIKRTHLFVGVLCHSRYAFAEFTYTQSIDLNEKHAMI